MSERNRESTDGELSDGSPNDSPKAPKRRQQTFEFKRSRISNRISYTNHSDDESGEMFTMQPGDLKSKSYEKERKEREKHSSKHRHERKDERREREGADERHRSKYDDRHRRHDAKYEDKRSSGEREKDKGRGKDRGKERKEREERKDREKERERREKKSRLEGRVDGRKHKRSPSLTDDSPASKREKKPSESKEKKPDSDRLVYSTKDRPAKSIEVHEVEHTPPSENPLIVDESLVIRSEAITSFTLDSDAGPKKYSKFDSSPEHEPEDNTPIHSDAELPHSDVEEDEEVEEVAEDPGFDVENADWEDLTDEQKASLTPDSKKRLEGDWQKRLIAQLPVYFPGIMGCRNVQEFHCENRIEEGTYGVVFRAKDKRTDEVVALKRLKMEKEKEGFPITSLREINMLLKAGNHPNIVNVKEVVIGSNMDKIYVAMEFVEHDLKSLMDTMKSRGKSFTVGVQKGLMQQLLSGLKHMHDLWILHRDLKSSNLLLSHKGILKIADFGLAREFGAPLKQYTQVVVTLWYRAPELLLGTKLYSTPIDCWSVGCLMAEFVLQKPLFPGQSEIDEIHKIFLELGTPNESLWPGYQDLPLVKDIQKTSLPQFPHNQLRKKFPAHLMKDTGFQLLNAFLRYDPDRRISCADALKHEWFQEDPKPTPPEMFPTFPAKSELHKAPPPSNRPQPQKPDIVVSASTAKLMQDLNVRPEKMRNTSFALKFGQF